MAYWLVYFPERSNESCKISQSLTVNRDRSYTRK